VKPIFVLTIYCLQLQVAKHKNKIRNLGLKRAL